MIDAAKEQEQHAAKVQEQHVAEEQEIVNEQQIQQIINDCNEEQFDQGLKLAKYVALSQKSVVSFIKSQKPATQNVGTNEDEDVQSSDEDKPQKV